MKRFILLALLIACVGFGLWAYFFGDTWLAEFNRERDQASEQQRQSGRTFGQQTDQEGCFAKALQQVDTCRSPICTIDTGNYLRGCWETSAKTENFCADVPEYNEEITEDEKSWARYGCWDMNNKSDGCRILMRQKQQLCDQQEQ